jgi:PPOX class probable F420-dependent enzyme
MDDTEMLQLVREARVARLATVRPDGSPHVVPVCFAVAGSEVVTAVDAKPKSTAALARLANVRANRRVSLLVDHYDDDWSALWWVRVDGDARVANVSDEHRDALAAKYPQYLDAPPAGDAIVVVPRRFTGWRHTVRRL